MLYLMLKWSENRSVMCDSLRPHGLYSPYNSPGQNTGVDSCSLFQGIFPTQGLNRGLLYCRRIVYQLKYQGSLDSHLITLHVTSFFLVSIPTNLAAPWGKCCIHFSWGSPASSTVLYVYYLLAAYSFRWTLGSWQPKKAGEEIGTHGIKMGWA